MLRGSEAHRPKVSEKNATLSIRITPTYNHTARRGCRRLIVTHLRAGTALGKREALAKAHNPANETEPDAGSRFDHHAGSAWRCR